MPESAIELPDVLPLGDIQVSEDFRYQTYEQNNSIVEKKRYEFKKGAVNRIVRVSGVTNNGDRVTFDKGTDYQLSADSEEIVWQSNRTPDAGTIFTVVYDIESVMGRYVDAHEEEIDSVRNDIDDVISAKFVDEAAGDELDNLGSLFGEVGRRRGKSDNDYRIYLKSLVQSLQSRGTTNQIVDAISAATLIDKADISIREDFQSVSYEVVISPKTKHRTSTVEDIAEIADPSGVNLDKIRYNVPEDTMFSDDNAVINPSNTASDSAGFDDSVSTSISTVLQWNTNSWDNNVWG